MPDAPRPTLRVIAQEAGISLAAASMALRDHPRISAPVRKRVQAVARRLGYHPDPKLSSLMQHLRMRSDQEYRETLAYVSSYPSYKAWKWMPHHDYYLGAGERALELGYRLDAVHLGEPGMTPARMSQQLVARGIRGILVGGFSQSGTALALEWKRFAAVAFDYSLGSPSPHRATTNYYTEMRSILDRLTQDGCSRIGLNLNSNDDAKVLGLAHSAYLHYQETLPPARRIPIHASPDGKGDIASWQERHLPDAIVSTGCCDFPQDYEALCGRPPPALRYVNANISYADERSQGIDKLSPVVGRLACEHLIAQLQRHEIGLPRHPQVVAVQGEWVDDVARWKREKEEWRAAVARKLQRGRRAESPEPVANA